MRRINPLVAGRRNRAGLTQLTERPHGRPGRPQPGVRVRQPMMQRTDEILDAALACAEARWSVVPIAPRGKQPLLPWLEFQQRRALPADRKSTRLNSVTNAHLVCRLLLEKKTKKTTQ